MTRRHSGDESAFNSAPDTGRLGFRYCWEPEDERPVVRLADCGCDGCREFYIRHARAKRPKSQPSQPKAEVVQSMPHVRMSHRERDRQLAKLREQVEEDR